MPLCPPLHWLLYRESFTFGARGDCDLTASAAWYQTPSQRGTQSFAHRWTQCLQMRKHAEVPKGCLYIWLQESSSDMYTTCWCHTTFTCISGASSTECVYKKSNNWFCLVDCLDCANQTTQSYWSVSQTHRSDCIITFENQISDTAVNVFFSVCAAGHNIPSEGSILLGLITVLLSWTKCD